MPKVVLITGCSSGFGLITAKYLTEKSYTVIPSVRKKSDLAKLPNTVLLDVTWSQLKINRFIDSVIEKYGRVDVLINNAGYGHLGSVGDLTADDAREQLETNFVGSFKVIKSVLPYMRQMKSGLILNVSSMLGLFSIPNHGIYSASKFALEGLSQSLRLEEAKNGVKIIVVNPGVFATSFREKIKIASKAAQEVPTGADPLLFAKLVEKIINSPNPHLSYLIDEDWKTKLLLLMPGQLRYRILSLYFK